MRRKSVVTITVRAWEQRHYWRRGAITDVEVWQAGRLLAKPPRQLPRITVEADYCQAHRTRIYSDLACQFCGERPVPHVTVPIDTTAPW